MNDLIMTIVCAVGVSATFIAMLIIFPCKRGLAFTITMFAVFTTILVVLMPVNCFIY